MNPNALQYVEEQFKQNTIRNIPGAGKHTGAQQKIQILPAVWQNTVLESKVKYIHNPTPPKIHQRICNIKCNFTSKLPHNNLLKFVFNSMLCRTKPTKTIPPPKSSRGRRETVKSKN
jgi:hypothetical protein